MYIKKFTNAQYDELARCPFCDDAGLMLYGDDCPHFVVAFQDGAWDPDLIPPVFCNGLRYQRNPLTQALAQLPGVVCKIKPISDRHPRIEAYFCVDPEKATELRERFRRRIFTGVECVTCRNDTAVFLDEESKIVCVVCGSPAEPTAKQ